MDLTIIVMYRNGSPERILSRLGGVCLVYGLDPSLCTSAGYGALYGVIWSPSQHYGVAVSADHAYGQ